MKNLKPSQLPEGTVIDDQKYGEYIKRADGIWEEMDCGFLGDRERVTDDGFDRNRESYKGFLSRTGLADTDKSDEYFKDYKVIAVPPGFVFVGDAEPIHGPWSVWFGSVYSDGSPIHDCKGYNCEF